MVKQLDLMTWPEVEERLSSGVVAILPVGSTEQHGPMGLIGTDTICARTVAQGAAECAPAIVAPEIAYTPAPFNTSFPGTVSVSPSLLTAQVFEVCNGLLDQGFLGVFTLNGHGANLDPIAEALIKLPKGQVVVESWWNPKSVNALRKDLYGDWEGMHATPSEVAITQHLHGRRNPGEAAKPPRKLSLDYIKSHVGDKHGPPDEHRAEFPDGRVGSHSALATPEAGKAILEAATKDIGELVLAFHKSLLAKSD